MLELVDVVKTFADGDADDLLVLDGVSLTVERGHMCALMGPSGSGKTTLLGLCTTRLQPDRGKVLVDGRNISDLSPRDRALYRRRTLGFIPQRPELTEGVPLIDQAITKLCLDGYSVRDARREVMPLLERLGLMSRLRHRPPQLSGGEIQRLAIARALAHRPTLILADEPTGALDGDRTLKVLTLLRELCAEQQVAMVIATHDRLAADHADDARRLAGGRLLPLQHDIRQAAPEPA